VVFDHEVGEGGNAFVLKNGTELFFAPLVSARTDTKILGDGA